MVKILPTFEDSKFQLLHNSFLFNDPLPLNPHHSLDVGEDDDSQRGIRDCFNDFCRQTILHGWHYLIDFNDDNNSSEEGDENNEENLDWRSVKGK